MDELKQYIPALVSLFLFLWSEYLGVSTKHKSNAIVQLIMCALSPKDTSDIEQTPPAVISLPPAVSPPSSQ